MLLSLCVICSIYIQNNRCVTKRYDALRAVADPSAGFGVMRYNGKCQHTT